MILDEIKNIKSDKKELRKFGNTIGAVLLVVSAFLFIYGKPVAPYFLGSGLALGIIAKLFPPILFPFQKTWMSISVVLGFIMTRVILSILFYIIITPISFISKLFGKDFLNLKIENEKKSYWNSVEIEYDKSTTEKQF